MKPIQIFFFFTSVFVYLSTYSQVDSVFFEGSKEFRVFTRPQEGAIVKLDKFKLKLGKPYYIKPGRYTFKAWAPTAELVTERFDLTNRNFVVINLTETKEYEEYRKKLKSYRLRKNSLRYLISGGAALYSLNSLINIYTLNRDANKEFENVETSKKRFSEAIWRENIEFYRSQYNNSKANYNNNLAEISEKWQSIGIVSGIAAISTYFTWKQSNKLKKPIYKETPLLSDAKVNPVLMDKTVALNITIKIR